jgi:predicted small lipoprotein YifL
MRQKLFETFLAASLAVSLAGCGTLEAYFSPGSQEAISVKQNAEKALTAAHTLHDAASLTASASFKSGACTNDCATKVNSYIQGSYTLLKDADGLSDPTQIMADVTSAVALISDAKGMIHK